MPGAVLQASPMRSTTPGPGFSSPKAARPPNIKAFNRGRDEAFSDALDFCKKGLNNLSDEMIQDVRVELANTIGSVRCEVTEIVEARSVRTDQKLDTIMSRLSSLAANMNEDLKMQNSQMTDPLLSRSVEQAEANRKLTHRREDQITHLTELLGKVTLQMENVQKKSDMDEMIERLLERMDLPGMLGMELAGFQQKFREMQAESKAHSADLSLSMEHVRKQLDRPVTKPTSDNTALLSELNRQQMEMDEEFQVMLTEIGKIQQALHLDFAMPDEDQPEAFTPRKQVQNGKSQIKVSDSFQREVSEAETRRRKKKRVREFSSQTDIEASDVSVQTDPELSKDKKKKHTILGGAKSGPGDGDQRRTVGLNDAEAMKAKARANLMRPQYDVMDHYHTDGFAQAIARSPYFDNLTVGLVCLNAVWIAIDTDMNKALIITKADPVFMIVDNLFCFYFSFELCIRFAAFFNKLDAFKDTWFVFDFTIVLNMILETWLIPLVMMVIATEDGTAELDLSMLRVVRMVKLLRLSRVSRVVRRIPELVIIVKAIGFAARSVIIFFLLWLVIIYIFAIVMRQITEGSEVGERWFSSVPESMNTLLLNGILADYAPFVNDLGNGSQGGSAVYWIAILIFVLLSAITIMYMLVGVLVEVVGVIATTEKEGIVVAYVAGQMRDKLETMGHGTEMSFTKYELQNLLIEPDVCELLTSVNVDVVVLIDMLDMVYEDIERAGGSMTFERMVDLLLNGRGANQATVRDTKEILRIMKQMMRTSTEDLHKKLDSEFQVVRTSLSTLREEALSRDGALKDSDSEEEETRVQASD